MNRTQMKKTMRSAIEHMSPGRSEQLYQILSACQQQGDETMQNNQTKKAGRHWTRWAVAAAAVLVIAVGAIFGSQYYRGNWMVDSQVILDVNPSIELSLNAKEKVIDVAAHNDNALKVLDGMDLKGTDLNVAVNALLGSLVKNGYIDDLANSILITVENDNTQRGAQLEEELVAEINRILSSQSIKGAVLSQNLSKNSADAQLKEMAQTYGISLGKASLIQTLTSSNPLLSPADMAGLSINELNLLLSAQESSQPSSIQSSGNASDKAYIGEEKAKQVAFSHAGVSEADVKMVKVKLDYDDGAVEYDIDFITQTGAFEYSIHATDGTVLSYEVGTVSQQGGANLPPSGTITPNGGSTSGDIGAEKAKQIALNHAGVPASEATFIKAHPDYDDGRLTYDVEFYTSSQEYDYEIDASTGSVIAYDHEIFYQSGGNSGNTGGNGTGGAISDEQARQIALAKAPGAQITSFQLDRDDGQMIYEIELRQGWVEYECEIRQSDGTIIKWEQDIDD